MAERSAAVLGEVPEWQPVRLAGLRAGEVGPFRCAAEIDAYREDVGRRVAAYGLQPLRWPPELPAPTPSGRCWSRPTRSRSAARSRSRSPRSARRSRAGATSPTPTRVMLAAAACEMHPVAVEKGARLGSIARRLDEATAAAAAAGVLDVPAVRVGERVFHGDRELEAAAAELAAA